jgi:major type 1 subunit fimbrin (pilin)
MNKLLLSAALVASVGVAALAPRTASAVDGTITITGKVVAQTCTVDGSAFGTPDNSVTAAMPLVLAPVLATSGAVAGKTQFQMVVANCDPSLSSVQAFFSGPNINTVTGNLKNPVLAGNATNVEVQLLNSTSAVMTLGGATAAAQNSPVVPLTGTTTKGATLSYFAQYYSTGGSTAGAVNTTVQFTMNYL